LYKGNTDPFNTTIIDVSAMQHLLLQQARAQSMRNTWPSEIALRRNHGAITSESLRKMPPFISDRASSHAVLAHAYYSASSRQRIQGQPYAESLVEAEKHKFQAVRSLQESIEVHRHTGDPVKLKRIFEACCWLSAAEMLSGNIQAAIVHLKASKNIVDILGGWSRIERMQKEILFGAVVNLAAGLRSRPVIEIEDFDPGRWRFHRATGTKVPHASEGLRLPLRNEHRRVSLNVTSRLSTFFVDMRELLMVEELKFKYANSKEPAVTQIFRWAHARKISVRARALHYWCDLIDAAKLENRPVLTLYVPVRIGLALPSPLPLNMQFALCAAMRTFDRCIFEEHYQPAGVFRESKRYHIELAALMEALRPASDDLSPTLDHRLYDVLWIYSVGAYVEDIFLRPELQRAGDPVPHQERFFSTRFSYIVATNTQFRRFDDITRLLEENYLYYPRLQEPSLRKLVELE
jgi:hypothetical protein